MSDIVVFCIIHLTRYSDINISDHFKSLFFACLPAWTLASLYLFGYWWPSALYAMEMHASDIWLMLSCKRSRYSHIVYHFKKKKSKKSHNFIYSSIVKYNVRASVIKPWRYVTGMSWPPHWLACFCHCLPVNVIQNGFAICSYRLDSM